MLSTKKRIAAYSLIIGVLVGVELNKMYTPANFESPWAFRFLSGGLKFVFGMVLIV